MAMTTIYTQERIRYRVGQLAYANRKPRSACPSPAAREGWDDAYQADACAASNVQHSTDTTKP